MRVLGLAAVVALMTVSSAAADGVKIGVNIGVPAPPPIVVATPPPAVVVTAPPPPIIVTTPPQLVVVPGTTVYYAPSSSINFFSYGGRYYSFHEGAWFVATTRGGSWSTISRDRVPQPVLGVPVTYYRIPPGHAKKMGRDEGPGRGCPPGLAKQGRC